MIIIRNKKLIKTLNQKSYDNVIQSLDLNLLSCPQCGHSHFHYHGSYSRTLIHNFEKIHLLIQRIQCQLCYQTHALLLFPIVPFCQLSFWMILERDRLSPWTQSFQNVKLIYDFLCVLKSRWLHWLLVSTLPT